MPIHSGPRSEATTLKNIADVEYYDADTQIEPSPLSHPHEKKTFLSARIPLAQKKKKKARVSFLFPASVQEFPHGVIATINLFTFSSLLHSLNTHI